jgi:hypothetical protein
MREILPLSSSSSSSSSSDSASVASFGPMFWAGGGVDAPPLFSAQTEAFNVSTLAAMDATTRADIEPLQGPHTVSAAPCRADQTGTTKCEWCPGGCQPFVDIPYDDAITNERAYYRSPGLKSDVLLYRSQADSFSFYASTRSLTSDGDAGDGGSGGSGVARWSAPAPTNIPNVKSNLDAGLLGDGRVFLASNPVTPAAGSDDDSHRDPVTLATSSDGGATFDRVGVALTCLDMPGHGRDTTCDCAFDHDENKGVSYPQAIAVVAPAPEGLRGTYVAASNNKEDVWVTKVTPP